jgi:hypothetical protein
MANNDIFNIQAQKQSYYPFDLALARDLVPHHTYILKYGRLTMPTTAVEYDLWTGAASGFASYPWPTAPVTLEIASTSANDTLEGTGARKVTLEGLDANYVQQTEEIELNGQTPVAATGTYIRMHRAYVTEVGSLESNEGSIWIADDTTTWTTGEPATDAYKLANIAAGEGQTEMAIYTIPAGYCGYFTTTTASMIATLNKSCALKYSVRAYNAASNNNYESWRNLGILGLSSAGDSVETYIPDVPLRFGAKTDIKLSATTDFTGEDVNARFTMYLVEEDPCV